MSCISRVCAIGCFWLVAAAPAFGGGDAADIDTSDTGSAAEVRPQALPPAQEAPIAQTGRARSGNPLWEIPLEHLSATRDRPIFSPSRRPRAIADAPSTAVAGPPVQAPRLPERPQLSLVGTILNGDDGFAIFLDQTTRVPLRLKMGAEHQGWMLRQIAARSVTLQKGEDVAVLVFPEPANEPTPAAAAAGVAKTWPDQPAPSPPPASTAQATPPYLSPESNALRRPARPQGNSARRR
jgi:hypothetical protein